MIYRTVTPRLIVWLAILLAAGCTTSAADAGMDMDAAPGADGDASMPLEDADAQAQACGNATSFGPSQISGMTPYGNLNLEFERTWFANGCGAMSMAIAYLPIEDYGYRFVVTFAVPALEFLEGKAYSQPGIFPASVATSVCNLDGENCFFHDTEGTVDIEILVDDEGLNPNTDVVLNLSGDAWKLSTLEVAGQSCSWTWNPC